jgi:hypothetical protein
VTESTPDPRDAEIERLTVKRDALALAARNGREAISIALGQIRESNLGTAQNELVYGFNVLDEAIAEDR